MQTVEIYTDGACSGNPGPGGWGTVLICGEHSIERSGFDAQTTNNRMEITAAIQALRCLKKPCIVHLHSDSSYLVNAFNQHWIANWLRQNWKKKNGSAVENIDLWQELLEAGKPHQIEWIWVKGHANNPYNNRCDELATGEIKAHVK